MAATTADIRELAIGPRSIADDGTSALDGGVSAAVVAGSIVAFAPGVSDRHRRDVLESLLLAQLAANVRAERHKDPPGWFTAYRGVLEQAGWIVESSSSRTRHVSSLAQYPASSVVNDVFRTRVTPEELGFVTAAMNAFRSDPNGAGQFVFECPSHSGGLGNFQVALAAEEDGTLTARIAQVSFNAPQHVTRLMFEEFTRAAQFSVAFLSLAQNADVYSRIRSAVSAKVAGRFQSLVAAVPIA